MKRLIQFTFLVCVTIVVLKACKPDPIDIPDNNNDWKYEPDFISLNKPSNFPNPVIPSDNPLTKQGVKLGRWLFYDQILSKDSSLACAGCHSQSDAFTDTRRFSLGIDGIAGTRNSMPLFNLAWNNSFFWDGRELTLEKQILEPVPNPIEMHLEWPEAVSRLQNSERYPKMFYEAFGEKNITKELTAKAIAQFLRTMVSGNSKFDKYVRGELFGTGQEFTEEEERGFDLFVSEPFAPGGGADCFHCHNAPLFMDVSRDGQFRNNGLTEAATVYDFPDAGRGEVTNNPADYGKFKIPSLRNLSFTAPYMHNGQFMTIEEVIDFYLSPPKNSPTLDVIMAVHQNTNGITLSPQDKQALKAFLLTLNDYEFINNPDFAPPVE